MLGSYDLACMHMTPTQNERESFLRNLRQSGLLSKSDFRHALERLTDIEKPRALARVLVDWGMLTKFQAELLLVGRAKGFFLGPYKIQDQLGQGGMGRVYKALHVTMNRLVALKVLAPHLVKTPKAQKLFQREVQAAAQLNHPNIVTAYDANEVKGRHYLAMEFVDGPNLEQLVREQGPLPVGMACEVIRQAANGMQHAHENDMIHRDLKPANLLMQPSKNLQSFVVKILDFGLARLNDLGAQENSGTIEVKENTVMGTPDFISPEQARNMHHADIRSDIYSLGCSFYFLLTGKVMFPGGTTMEKLLRHVNDKPQSIEEFRQDVPTEVLAILKQMTAKDPDQRYQIPEALAAALVPLSGACAPNWDNQARRAAATFSSNTPVPKSIDAEPKSSDVGMVGTLPADLAPTAHASLSEGQTLPGSGDTQDFQSGKRKVLRWALGLAAVVVGALLIAFFLLNQ